MAFAGTTQIPTDHLRTQIFHFVPTQLRKSSIFIQQGDRLQIDGTGLPSALNNLLGRSRSQFSRLEKCLTSIIPTVEEIHIVPAPAERIGPLAGQALEFKCRNADDIPASQMSDFVLLVLACFTAVETSETKMLLLEEPESGIYPRALGDLVTYLRRATEEIQDLQVLMTSHSPYLVDHLKPEEVILTRRGVDGFTQAAPLNDLPDLERWTETLTVGELWTSSGEDELIRRILAGKHS